MIKKRLLIGFLAWAVVGPPDPLRADDVTFTFTKLADSFDAFPDDPNSTFVIPADGAPAVDGDTVVFIAQPYYSSIRSLWSLSISAGTAVRLADSNTPIPQGTGTFSDYVSPPFRTNDGVAVFRGGQAGIYSVSTSGGDITMVANQNIPIPDIGNTLFGTDAFTDMKLDAGNLVFVGRAHAGGYSVSQSGGPISSIGNNVFICEDGYGFGGISTLRMPELSGDTVALLVTNVFGQGAIYTAPLSGLTGVADKCAAPMLKANNATRVASLNTPVPADPRGRNFDSRSFGTALIDGGTIVFPGAAGDDLSGLYASSTGGLVKLADTNTPVPGGMGNFAGFAEYTLSGGNVVFRAWDAARIDGLYYVPASGGEVTKIIAIGDPLDNGRTVTGNGGGFYQPPIQEGSLSGNEFGFRVDFRDAAKGTTGVGIYLVTIQPAN